jgi:hypothetical protein
MTDHPNRIFQYMHCARCLREMPAGVSPRTWSQLECGWTQEGLQVWCKRHNLNVVDLDFLGQKVSPYAPQD